MQQSQRIILYILVLVAGAAWTLRSTGEPGASTDFSLPAPQTGFLAPDFTLQSMEGETFTLSELRGNAVLINLWATWCPPCRAEMPAIERIYREYKDQGFVVLAVNATNQDDPLAIVPFAEEYDLTFPILLDESGKVGALYQLRSLPSSFFIDRNGVIQEIVIGGPMSEALLRTRVERILE